jgi:hypothetical protein
LGHSFANLPTLLRGFEAQLKDYHTKIDELNAKIDELNALATESDRAILFSKIGLALTRWAKMEEVLVAIAALLLRTGADKAGLVMYSILNFNTWLTIIHDLFEMDDTLSSFQNRWNKLSERIRRIKDQRDQLAHHPVHGSEKIEGLGAAILKASAFDTRQKSKQLRPLDSEEVGAFAESVMRITNDLHSLFNAMYDALEASHKKSVSPATGHYSESDSR